MLVWLLKTSLNAHLRTTGTPIDSQSGHIPGLGARSPAGGVQEASHIDVSLPLSLSPLCKNKSSKKMLMYDFLFEC